MDATRRVRVVPPPLPLPAEENCSAQLLLRLLLPMLRELLLEAELQQPLFPLPQLLLRPLLLPFPLPVPRQHERVLEQPQEPGEPQEPPQEPQPPHENVFQREDFPYLLVLQGPLNLCLEEPAVCLIAG